MADEAGPYVCPLCRSSLSRSEEGYSCRFCRRVYSVKNEIPNFLTEPESESENPMIRSVGTIDRLAKIYETGLWYPIVYHIYGGIKIPPVKETVERVTEMTDAEGGVVLDVACGTGIYTRSIARRAANVYGIDISQGMLEQARKLSEGEGLDNVVLSRADVEKLPFTDDFFDAACCAGALHLFPDTVKALKEIGRVLKPEGPLAVMTFTRRRFLKYKFVYEHLRKDHGAHIFEVDELAEWLEEAGFKDFNPEIYGSMLLFNTRKTAD
jgi:SAM-dependent methyltransferase